MPHVVTSEGERSRGLGILLLTSFMAWAGFFVVIPLISVQYVDQLGWTAASVGLVLAVRQFLQQGITMVAGAMADRFGAKRLICAGMLLRSIGFLSLAVADSYPRLMLSAVLTALGGALFDSPQSAAIAALTDEDNRRRFFSLNGTLSGLGIVLGTQLGAFLITRDFQLVCIAGAACFFAIFVVTALFLPDVAVSSGRQGFAQGLAMALSDRTFIRYNALLMGYWFMWSQFSISIPLAAASLGGESSVAWVYAINSIVTILFGYLLPRLLEQRLSAIQMLILGIAIVASGMGLIALTGTYATFLACIFILSIGTVFARPGERTVTSDLASPDARGSYFGVASLSIAIGGGTGNFAGGVLYDLAATYDAPAVPWLIFAAFGTAAAFGLWRMSTGVLAAPRPIPLPGNA